MAPIAVAAAPQALACSDSNTSNHCYAVGYFYAGENHGIAGELMVGCLYQPNNGSDNFATNEIWDTDDTGNYWEEVGVISGTDYNFNYDYKNWFWADSRPGGGFHQHVANVAPAGTGLYAMEIYYEGSDKWGLIGGNSTVSLGTSTSQSATLTTQTGGTEYLGDSTSGIRDSGGTVSGLEYESTNSNWYYWGNGGSKVTSGPGNYIKAGYIATKSQAGWSGPC